MKNQLWTLGLVAATASLIAPVAQAADVAAALDQSKAYSEESVASMDQVTSVSQLSDVKPTDWAFQALQSLVERYGCIAGYPDRTYRGNRALTRYEFAAGLNACLDRVNELIAAGTANLAKKEDLAAMQKLQEQFAAELATLRGRVDGLTTKTATLEKQQFSTTTKLKGDVIFSFSGLQGGNKAVPANSLTRGTVPLDENTTFSDRVRLSLVTSFTGKDQLVTRLQARNVPNFNAAAGTNNARLSYEGSGPSDNSVSVDKLYYRTTFGKASITLDAIGGEFYNNVPNGNPLLASDSLGSISRFGRFNPMYRGGVTGAGITATLPLSEMFSVSAGYLVDTVTNATGVPIGGAAFPTAKNGLFGGSNSFLAQINAKPIKDLSLGLTYVRSYDASGNIGVTGATGSGYANAPFTAGVPTSADNLGIEASYKFGPAVLSGWTGWTKAHAMKTNDITGLTGALKGDDASLFTWSVNLAFPDLGKKGNLAAIIIGQPPKVTKNDFGSGSTREDSRGTFHFEALYRYALNDKVAITPGFVILTNPEGRSNDTIYLGTVRTTFSF
jgi:Carbohydrate-selective porin, OprB family/S-layer homology domain